MDTSAKRLRAARIAKGFPGPTEAARACGWKVPTYTHHENGTRKFGRDAARKYGRAFGVKASYLLMLGEGDGDTQAPTVGLPVVAEAALGVWHEVREGGVDSMSQNAEKISVPQSIEWRADDEYGVQIRDRSLDKFILRNEWAVCRPIKPGPVDLDQFEVNDFLHIERIKKGLREISVRRVRSKDGRLKLSTYSTDPKLRGEITYPSSTEQVIIKGIVVGKYVRLTRS